MSHVVTQLVRRLATPATASALAKEELCLALAAIAQLAPAHTDTSPAGPRDTAGHSTEPLARRSLRFVPLCAPQEVRMIAQGASALQWPTTSPSALFLTNALVQQLHKHVAAGTPNAAAGKRMSGSSSRRVRLADVLAVAQHAMEAHLCFDATLHAMLTEYAPQLACQGSTFSTAAAEELVAVTDAYVGQHEAALALQRISAALAQTPLTHAPGMQVLQRCVSGHAIPIASSWTARHAKWVRHRRRLLDAFEASSTSGRETGSEVDAADSLSHEVVQQQKARFDVLQMVRSLRAAGEAAPAPIDQLLHTLEAVRVFQISDPLTVAALDAAVLQLLGLSETSDPSPSTSSPGRLTPTRAAVLEGHVYAQPLRYPRTLAALRLRDEASLRATARSDSADSSAVSFSPSSSSSQALQPISPVLRVYAKAVLGERVSEKDLFLVSNDLSSYTADEVAQCIFVFAHMREVPTSLIAALANSLCSVTLHGVEALLRAARQDRTGALRTVVEACLSASAHLQHCVVAAPVDVLVAVAGVLAQPPTRWVTTATQVRVLEAQLAEVVLAQVQLQLDVMPPESLLLLLSEGGVGKLPGGAEVVESACARLADLLERSPPAALNTELCTAVLAALQAGETATSERLLDALASSFACSFEALSAASADDTADFAAFLGFVARQLSYGSPELADVAGSVIARQAVLTRSVEWSACPPALLVAAALFSLDPCNVSTSFASTVTMPQRVLAYLAEPGRLAEPVSTELTAGLAELLYRLPAVEATVVLSMVSSLSSAAASLSPLAAAKLVSVTHRTLASLPAATLPAVSPLPASVYANVCEHAQGLPTDVFAALCGLVASPFFDEALATRLLEVLLPMSDRLTPHQLSCCVFGLGEVRDAGQRLSHQVMTEALSDYVVDNVDLFTSSRDIASLLHGFARLQCTKRNLYSVFATQLKRRSLRVTLDYKAISFLFFAFGSAKFVDKELMDFFARVFLQHTQELAAPDLLMALRGASRMCLLNGQLYWKLGDEVAKRADEFPLVSQCELVHAYGAIEQRHPRMASELAKRITANVAALPSASAVVDVVVSLWLMDHKVASDDGGEAIAAHLAQRAGEMTSDDLVKLCCVVTDVQWSDRALLDAIVVRAIELKAHERLEASAARAVLDTLSSQLVFNSEARTELSQLARSVSKEMVQLSGEEQDQLNLLTSH